VILDHLDRRAHVLELWLDNNLKQLLQRQVQMLLNPDRSQIKRSFLL